MGTATRSELAKARFGEFPERAAARFGAVPIWLDRPPDIAPSLGFQLDYVTFADLTRDVSAWLAAAGVRAGERVAVIKQNNFDIQALVLGAARMGAVAAPISALQEPEMHATLLERLEAAVLVTDERSLAALRATGVPDARLARSIVVVDGGPSGAISLDDLRGGAAPEAAPRGTDEAIVITHTSGTTGVPKLTMHTGRSLFAHAGVQARALRLLGLREPAAVCISWTHIRASGGLATLFAMGLRLGALTDPEPGAASAALQRIRPGLLEAHPNILMLWEQLAGDPARPLAGVRFFASTFDAIHPRTIRTLLGASKRRGAVFVQGYGQSEIGPATLKVYTRGLPFRVRDGRCVGWPMPGFTRVRIIDPESGRSLGPGRPGQVEVASRGMLVRYVGEDERTAAARSAGWWKMGDVGFKSRWGCLHLLDRTSDLIPEVPSTLRCEDLLLSRMPALTEVVIVQGPEGRAVPVLSTADDRPLDPAQWAEATAGLPALMPPVQIAWSAFPRTATWKVRRFVLAQSLAQRVEPPSTSR